MTEAERENERVSQGWEVMPKDVAILAAKIAPAVYERFIREGVWKKYDDWKDGVAAESLSIATAILERAQNDPNERARRIRALVREWVGNGTIAMPSACDFERAAQRIDAIDSAEIPRREDDGKVSRE